MYEIHGSDEFNIAPLKEWLKNNENRGALITFTGCELSYSNYQTDSLWQLLYWKIVCVTVGNK